jgi:DNA-binding NarL/FixJ family response regulator
MRLLVADANGFVRLGIQRALDNVDGFECVGEAAFGPQLVTQVARLKVDLVLLDMCLPGIEVLFALVRIRETDPDVRVIVLASHASPEEMRRVCAGGASGVILKTIAAEDLAGAIRQIVKGTFFTALGLPTSRLRAVVDAG